MSSTIQRSKRPMEVLVGGRYGLGSKVRVYGLLIKLLLQQQALCMCE